MIITDSNYLKEVYNKLPKKTNLTTFSILFSAYKGDIKYFINSVKVLEDISKINNILIVEACTHPPQEEDIGTVKIPKLLKRKYNKEFNFSFLRGDDFNNFEKYDLIIHCGACMFNKQHTLSRVKKASTKSIPMTTYGILLAYLNDLLNYISFP